MNEAESLIKKAVRGAGYSWGVASETGGAARLLFENGLPADKALASLLGACPQKDKRNCGPADLGNEWRGHGQGGHLCPLMAGLALCDNVAALDASAPITLLALKAPLLLVPFASYTALTLGASITLSWSGAMMSVDGVCVRVVEDVDLLPDVPVDVTCEFNSLASGVGVHESRVTFDATAHAALSAFAHKTYAPATEESRRKGAGDSG